MKDLVIVGSGGFAKEVAFLIDEINNKRMQWNLLGFIDSSIGETNGKYFIYQNDEWLERINNEINVVFGIGAPNLIERLFKKFSVNKNIKYPNLIHPNVVGDWEKIILGKGNIFCASNTFTTDIVIGNFNIFNLDCTIGHDTKIGDFNVINPSVNISGGIIINDNTLLGTSSTILQNIEICSNSIIGASSLVTKDIVEEGTYVGVPVKKIKT